MVDVAKLCMGCMEDRGSETVCPRCGYREGADPASPLHLRPRTELQGQYLVGRVLGHGGFGITYLSWDLNLERKVAVKEYMPGGVAVRTQHATEVMPSSGDMRKDFEYGLQRYLDEARTVARFQAHPAIVSVLNFFRANGTAYLVMEYLEGVTLERYLETNGNRTTMETVLTVMTPVMEALHTVHQQGILHRDVSPDNIYITRKWQVKVLDFGAARYALGQKSRNLSVILKEGYAPIEQYHSKGNQGPWTDVYACGATIYRALTGVIPPGSLDRMTEDKMHPLRQFGVEMTDPQERAILKALAVQPEQRFHTMQDFRDALTGLGGVGLIEATGEKLPAFVEAMPPDDGGRPISRETASVGYTKVVTGAPSPVTGRPVSQHPVSQPQLVSAPPSPKIPVPKWVWAAVGGALVTVLAIGVWNSMQENKLQEQLDRQQESSRQTFEAEIQKQRELAQETEKRDRERAGVQEKLRQDEEELKQRQEELEKQQKSLQSKSQPGARSIPTIPAPKPDAATPAPTGQNAPSTAATLTPAAPPAPTAPAAPTYEDLIRKAQDATRARNYPLSSQISQQAIQLNGARPEAYANLGWVSLYGTGDLQAAAQNYRQAIDKGGTVWFRVFHDHQNGSFATRCMGDLGISKDTVLFVGQDGSHNLKGPRSSIQEVKEHRFPFRPVSGDFHIKLNDNRQYNIVSVTNAKPIRDLIVGFLR